MADPFVWGPGGQKLSMAQVLAARRTAESLAGSRPNPQNFGQGLEALTGKIGASLLDWKASSDEAEGRSKVAEALANAQQGGDASGYLSVLGDEFASPQQSAVAQALLQRQWEMEKPKDADWQTFDSNGDVYRWNANDPDSTPSVFFDGPDAPKKPPQVETRYNPETGRDEKVQWNGESWEPLGGQKAPSDPLVSVDVNNGGAGEKFYESMDSELGKQNAALIDAGRNAASNNVRLQQLGDLLQTAPQGAPGVVTQFAGSLGIPTEGLDELQAAQALINQMVPGQRPPGSGTMSDADLQLFKASLPQIINQPGGNQLILTTAIAINEYTAAQAAIAEQVANREITPAEARQMQAALPNPLERIKEATKAADAPKPGMVEDGYRFKGGDPSDPKNWEKV